MRAMAWVKGLREPGDSVGPCMSCADDAERHRDAARSLLRDGRALDPGVTVAPPRRDAGPKQDPCECAGRSRPTRGRRHEPRPQTMKKLGTKGGGPSWPSATETGVAPTKRTRARRPGGGGWWEPESSPPVRAVDAMLLSRCRAGGEKIGVREGERNASRPKSLVMALLPRWQLTARPRTWTNPSSQGLEPDSDRGI